MEALLQGGPGLKVYPNSWTLGQFQLGAGFISAQNYLNESFLLPIV